MLCICCRVRFLNQEFRKVSLLGCRQFVGHKPGTLPILGNARCSALHLAIIQTLRSNRLHLIITRRTSEGGFASCRAFSGWRPAIAQSIASCDLRSMSRMSHSGSPLALVSCRRLVRRLRSAFIITPLVLRYAVLALLKHVVPLRWLVRWAWRPSAGSRDREAERQLLARVLRVSSSDQIG